MNEEKKEEPNGIGLGIVLMVVVSLVVGIGLYAYFSEPYTTADKLRDQLNNVGDVSEDYKQGWLDCVNYYLHMKTAPTNVTALISFVLKLG